MTVLTSQGNAHCQSIASDRDARDGWRCVIGELFFSETEFNKSEMEAVMQASGAVSRVRQARNASIWPARRGRPHESRRGRAFCTTCGGAASEHDGSR